MQLAPDETTAADDFKFERSPDVYGVVVDCNSESGCVQISGGGKPTIRITTGPGESGFRFEVIPEGQSCMLYGCPTVWYIVPRSKLLTVDLCSFLTRYNERYPSLTVNMGFGGKDLPSVTLPHELLQELLEDTIERNKQRMDLEDSGTFHFDGDLIS